MRRDDSAQSAAGIPRNFRRGVTLIELLVVISLLVMITAVTVPAVAPSIRQRRQREAARLVSSYIAAARSRAMETGRPVAVVLERFNPGLGSINSAVQTNAQVAALAGSSQTFAMNLSVAESPPPYAGDFTTSTVIVTNSPPQSWPQFSPQYQSQVEIYITSNDTLWSSQSIRVGDAIRFNYQGPLYYFDTNNAHNTNGSINAAAPLVAGGGTPSSTGWTAGLLPDQSLNVLTVTPASGHVPYQIFRQPTTTSAVTPLQLPEGIVVDMYYSGMNTANNSAGGAPLGCFAYNNGANLFNTILSFSPSGAMTLVYDNGQPIHPTGSIFLLLGRREQVHVPNYTPPSNLYANNFLDPSSLWIVINPQTGQVTTAENYVPTYDSSSGTIVSNISAYSASDPSTPAGLHWGVFTARTFASGAVSAAYHSPVTTVGGN